MININRQERVNVTEINPDRHNWHKGKKRSKQP